LLILWLQGINFEKNFLLKYELIVEHVGLDMKNGSSSLIIILCSGIFFWKHKRVFVRL